VFHRLFPESGLESATLCVGQSEELVDDSSDERADAHLLKKFGMGGSFENYTSRVKSNRAASMLACISGVWVSNNVPNHALVLLLPNIGRHFAVNSSRLQGHGQSLCHILLY